MVVRIVGIRLTPTTMLIMIPISTATNTPVKPPVRFYIRSAPPIQFYLYVFAVLIIMIQL